MLEVDYRRYEDSLARLGGYPGGVRVGVRSRSGPLGGACRATRSFVLSGARRERVHRRAVAGKGIGLEPLTGDDSGLFVLNFLRFA